MISIYELSSRCLSHLEKDRVNDCLVLVHDFVERIVTENLCTSQVFGSQQLDELCIQIGRHNFAINSGSYKFTEHVDLSDKKIVLYIVSKMQKSGGHSKLIQNFIASKPDFHHVILSTCVAGSSDAYLLKKFKESKNKNISFFSAPRGNMQNKLTWLQSFLTHTKADHIYLFNHHQDCVAVSALLPEFYLKASYVHHCDHHLSLGIYMTHLTHIDLHPMGYHYCGDVLGVKNRYLPLTLEDINSCFLDGKYSRTGPLITATAPGANKFEIPYYVSYLDLIPRIMKVTGGKHIHIGRLTFWARCRIRSQMRKLGISQDRFQYIEWVPSVWKALQDHKVDLYLASFPYGAGLTLIEAMGAGVPIIMHRHMFSRVLSSLELAYPEAFSWSDPEKLLDHLSKVNEVELAREKILSRKQYETFHRPEILRRYLEDDDSLRLPVPELNKEFKPRLDVWASWAQSQFSLTHLCYRFIYRTFRKIRLLLN